MTSELTTAAPTTSTAPAAAIRSPITPVEGVSLHGPAWTPLAETLLTPRLLRLLARLHHDFEPQRQQLLAARAEHQAAWDAGGLPGYEPGPSPATHGDWTVAPLPADLRRRRVEITGPANDPKMVINMLSRTRAGHRADTAMLDFEDAMKPTWANVLDAVRNVRDAARGTLEFHRPASGERPAKRYALDTADMAGLMVRVRGLHLDESNLQVDGQPLAGGILDFTLAMAYSAQTLLDNGRTPKYYVPKCQHYLEARWWNNLFVAVQEALDLPAGTLRATFLIETLPAAFQMEEILYEIRDHAAGLNVGRWDKIFSDIKVLKMHPDRVLADRAHIGLNQPWMRDYARRLIQVCHRRGALGIGGMAAFTPGRDDEVRAAQTAKVKADKELEAELGHDGCWVSHPYFIGTALAAFPRDNQLDVVDETRQEPPDLLPLATPPHTLDGLRTNARVGIAYLKGWNAGLGCVAWDDLMEDLATLEISRAQTWQWLHHRITLDDGTTVTPALVAKIFDEELARIEAEYGVDDAMTHAAAQARALFTRSDFGPFLATASELA